MGATSGAGTAYPCITHEVTPPFLVGFVLLYLSFMCSGCPFVLFLFASVLSVFPFTDSDDLFGVFKFFLLGYFRMVVI